MSVKRRKVVALTQKEILLRFLSGDFDKMSNLPARVQRRMKKKGWWYGHTSCVWLKRTIPKSAYHRDVYESGSAAWAKDVKDCFRELGLIGTV